MLRRIEQSGIFQNGSFFPHPDESTRGFLSDIHCNNLLELQEVKLTGVWMSPKLLCPPGVFLSQCFPH